MGAVLAIDTSSKICSVAVLSGESVHSRKSAIDNSHSEDLAKLTEGLLAEAGLGVRQISHIVCGAGPGSFTGLRIGLAFAKGLAQGLGAPLTLSCSFQAAASQVDFASGRIAVAADARRQEVFWAEYELSSAGLPQASAEPTIISIESALTRLASGLGLVFSGNLFEFPGFSPEAPRVADDLAVGLLKNSRLGVGPMPQSAADLGQISPSYIREAAARTIAERGDKEPPNTDP